MLYIKQDVLNFIDICEYGMGSGHIIKLPRQIIFNDQYIITELEGFFWYSKLPKYTMVELHAAISSENYRYSVYLGDENRKYWEFKKMHLSCEEVMSDVLVPFLDFLEDFVVSGKSSASSVDRRITGTRSKDHNDYWSDHLKMYYAEDHEFYEKYYRVPSLQCQGIRTGYNRRTFFNITIGGRCNASFEHVGPEELVYKKGSLYIQGVKIPLLDNNYVKKLFWLLSFRSKVLVGELILLMRSDGCLEYAEKDKGISLPNILNLSGSLSSFRKLSIGYCDPDYEECMDEEYITGQEFLSRYDRLVDND